MDKEEITHLERMIELHKKNLYALEEMLASMAQINLCIWSIVSRWKGRQLPDTPSR